MFVYTKTIAAAVGIVSLAILLLLSPLPTVPECSGTSASACTHTDPDSPDSTPVPLTAQESLTQQRTFKLILFISVALTLGSMSIPISQRLQKRQAQKESDGPVSS